MSMSVEVIMNKRIRLLLNQQAYEKSCNKRVNRPWFTCLIKYPHSKQEDDHYTLSVQDQITFIKMSWILSNLTN